MKFLIICNYSSGLYNFRGMLLEELIARDNCVSAIIPLTNDSFEIAAEAKLENLGIDLIAIPMERRGINPFHDLKLLLNYKTAIEKCKPDLVITYTIKPNAYGGLICRYLNVPYVANITGLGTAFHNDGLLRKFVSCLYKVALKKARVVFFENEENRSILINDGIITEKQSHLLNGAGVDLNRYNVLLYPMNKKEIRFLFIGRVMREKGIDELFKAMCMLRELGIPCSLDVLGEYEEDYEELIKKYEAEGWLHYHGYQTDIRPFIAKCHCFVLPSWHEGMANTNLECAASARPIITSAIHGCMEAVIDGKSGYLCEKQNAENLFQVMKKFTELTLEQMQMMGVKAREHMENYFDKRKIVAETIKKLLQ